MIESISIKKVATYDDIGIQINDLKKVNFFFGYNGSGKSTIAKYLYNLSLEESQRNLDFNECCQTGYNNTAHQILVFDENFTEINFNKNPLLKGVFSLNQKNDLIDRQIVAEEEKIKTYSKYIEDKSSLKKRVEADRNQKQMALLEHCWAARASFNTFLKIDLIHPGSKPNHLLEIRRVLQNPINVIPTIQQLKDTYTLLYENDLKEIGKTISVDLYKQIRNIEGELNGLMLEVIVGNEDVDISALIKVLDSRNWVETGVRFIEKTEDVCPFCQKKTIDDELLEQFNKFFDTTYKEKIERIKYLREQYDQKSAEFLSSVLEIQAVFNPNNFVSNLYLELQRLFNENGGTINEKIIKSNEKKSITSLVKLKNDLSKIISGIKDNNKNYSELDSNKKNFLNDIWVYMASNCNVKIKENDKREIRYIKVQALANQLIEANNSKIFLSKQSIENLRSQTVNTKEAVDNINLILKNTGFEGFEIAEKDTVNNISQYYLKRQNTANGEPIFKSLSEGEKNFISFLYFYQLCVGTDDIQSNSTKKKIIVFDDPVSSLDSQALFVVSTLIHSLILRKGKDNKPAKQAFKNDSIAQVFVLTHNLYFYKEVSFKKRPICTDYWHYKITKINNKSEVTGDYNKSIHDDYSLLWNSIKELKVNMPNDSSLNIAIANSMRRIIESFVNFIGYPDDSWGAVLNENKEDPSYYIKCAFISTINDESHKVTALDGVYYQKIIYEQPQILFDVFKEIFKSIGKEHYELMMEETIN